MLLISALPLLWTPNIAVARAAPGAFQAAIPGMLLFMADGWISAGYFFTWQIGLFLSLGESFLAYGGALAASAFVGALCGLVLGRRSIADKARAPYGSRWVSWPSSSFSARWRSTAPRSGVVANALGSLASVSMSRRR